MAKDPYRYFRIEAHELLDQLCKGALELESSALAGDQVPRLLRIAHTLKGAAHVVKQAVIADLAHAIEGTLALYREGKQAVPHADVDVILGKLDLIAARLADLPAADGSEAGQAAPANAASSNSSANSPVAPPENSPLRMARADTAVVDALLEGLGEISSELTVLKRMIASVVRARELAAPIAGQLASPQLAEAQFGIRHSPLVKARSMMEAVHALILAAERGIVASVDRVERELQEARETAGRLRLIPATSVFNALERTARDAAYSVGKQLSFHASGGDVRLDGQVLDTVQNALVQIVRNAVAHGIETQAERIAAGKPPAGEIKLKILRRGYRISFRCSDDGRGVDLGAVRQALQRKGHVAAATEQLDAAALLAVLLKGGISTAAQVTELAGRGIGLDVVRAAMQQLGGEIIADTHTGTGTSIELLVPVSLASIQALIVESAGTVAAIPLDAVRSTLRLATDQVVQTPEGEAIQYEGRLIPLVKLAWAMPSTGGTKALQAISIVVVAAVAGIAAVVIDKLHGTENIVLQPLPALAPSTAIVAGTHLDNEGNPRLVLEPEALVSGLHGQAQQSPQALPMPPVLVIDDSLTTRMLESSILESAGFQVDLAASAEEALEMARQKSYALFLVDLEMPGMNGFEFIEHTRADAGLRSIPCILVTSRDSPEDKRRGETVGASAYIVKGEFDQVDFLQRVGNLVRQ